MCGPPVSGPTPANRRRECGVYPYLLEKAEITRPSQVWAADITTCPWSGDSSTSSREMTSPQISRVFLPPLPHYR